MYLNEKEDSNEQNVTQRKGEKKKSSREATPTEKGRKKRERKNQNEKRKIKQWKMKNRKEDNSCTDVGTPICQVSCKSPNSQSQSN